MSSPKPGHPAGGRTSGRGGRGGGSIFGLREVRPGSRPFMCRAVSSRSLLGLDSSSTELTEDAQARPEQDECIVCGVCKAPISALCFIAADESNTRLHVHSRPCRDMFVARALARASLSLSISTAWYRIIWYAMIWNVVVQHGMRWYARLHLPGYTILCQPRYAVLCIVALHLGIADSRATASRLTRSSTSERLSIAVCLCLPRAVSFRAISQSTA